MSSPETSPAAPRKGKWSRRIFRIVWTLVVPLVLLGALEGGLRLFGYGYETGFLVRQGDAFENNTRFGWRFFPRDISREAGAIHLPAEKPAGVYRIAVLGGSAAQGVPDDAFAFGRFLEVMLEKRFPDARFEIINAAMTAVNSHVMLQVARDLAAIEPDLFIVYMGNNEVVGPFGAGTVFMGYSPSLGAIRAGLWVKSTRVGQLTESITRALADSKGPDRWGGMKMLAEQRVAFDSPKLATTLEHFRRNLADICEAAEEGGTAVIVCTVPVNLRHCAPFAAVHRTGMTDEESAIFDRAYERGVAAEDAGQAAEALDHYQAALAVDATFADLHFRMGRCRLATGDDGKAHEHFVLAREHDALRFRADSGINSRIREVAGIWRDRGVSLVDAEKVLADSDHTTARSPGEGLFHEHVHLTPQGSYEVGLAVFEEVLRRLPESIANTATDAPTASFEDCAERLALTNWDRGRHQAAIWQNINTPPFTEQLNNKEMRQRALARRRALWKEDVSAGGVVEAYERAIRMAPDDHYLRRNALMAFSAHGRFDRATDHLQHLVTLLPNDPTAQWGLGNMYLARAAAARRGGDLSEALRALSEAGAHLRRYSDLLENRILAHQTVVKAYWQAGRLELAESACRWALEQRPESPALLNLLAETLFRKRDAAEALRVAHQAIEIDDTYAAGHNLVGQILLLTGEPAEAADYFRKAIELDPHLAPAHANLAAARWKTGDLAGARESLAKAVDLAPDDVESLDRYGQLLQRDGQFRAAVESYEQALSISWHLPAALHLSWVLATCDDPEVRDITEATVFAKKAAISSSESPGAWINLAAVQAVGGDFAGALESAGEARSVASKTNNDALIAEIDRHIEHYSRQEVVPAYSGTIINVP